jgi:hypothetical protein
VIVFRHADPRFPFLWESSLQPPGRWHGEGEGPAHYFADTPDGAWAEFLRHEEITDPADLPLIRRALWAVEIPDRGHEVPFSDRNPPSYLGRASYPLCQQEASRLRAAGANALAAQSAALLPGGARGWVVEGGLQPGTSREGRGFVLFGLRSDLTGWAVTLAGFPPAHVLELVRHFDSPN